MGNDNLWMLSIDSDDYCGDIYVEAATFNGACDEAEEFFINMEMEGHADIFYDGDCVGYFEYCDGEGYSSLDDEAFWE